MGLRGVGVKIFLFCFFCFFFSIVFCQHSILMSTHKVSVYVFFSTGD